MNPVLVLMREHEAIEIELSELDFIIGEGENDECELNYSNLVHTFQKLCKFWNDHEKKEEEIFEVMEKEGFEIPVDVILLDHKMLKERKKKIEAAIKSGSDFEIRKVLRREMREFVDIIREHIELEGEVLSGVIVSDFSKAGKKKIGEIIERFELGKD